MAMFCARITFLAVIGKNAPAFTVASFTMSMTSRSLHSRQPGDHAGRRRAAPLFIHAPSHVGAELEELRARIDEERDAFARSQPALLVLRLDGLVAPTLLDDLAVIAHLRDQFGHGFLVALEAGRVGLHLAVELRGRSGGLVMVSHIRSGANHQQ